jgi:alpha-aminoadipic semialdehyde synthase
LTIFFRFPRTEPVLLDVHESPVRFDDLIQSHNVVVSLLPWTLHPEVAKRCIAKKVDMVTASYCTEQMQALHKGKLSLLK